MQLYQGTNLMLRVLKWGNMKEYLCQVMYLEMFAVPDYTTLFYEREG